MQAQGLAVRQLAVETLGAVFAGQQSVDDFLDESPAAAALDRRDRGFLAAIVYTALRHNEAIMAVLNRHLAKPLPRKAGPAGLILRVGLAELLFLGVPPHAVINSAVELARLDGAARHFTGLINAVLRKVAGERASLEINDAIAPWLAARWTKSYGPETAGRIATASLREAPLDITARDRSPSWAEKLGGVQLPAGSVRIASPPQAIDQMPGCAEGGWWVQDAAAAIPARLFGNLSGLAVLDLCAAPGGKTLQLAAQGARVTAVDQSARRLQRLAENLARTRLSADLVCADVFDFVPPQPFDAVLLDAPCSATGTIRRHPDLPYRKSSAQIGALIDLQWRMLNRAAALVRPGGTLVYCTCSIEPEEGEKQALGFLAKNKEFQLLPISSGELALGAEFISAQGFFRSLPFMKIGEQAGLDGFFAARFQRQAG
mgnify:CR=1 FL=1